jgi:hypothetical protein
MITATLTKYQHLSEEILQKYGKQDVFKLFIGVLNTDYIIVSQLL